MIREELGEDNMLSDAEEFETATKKLKASKEIKEKLMKEIHRFKKCDEQFGRKWGYPHLH